MVARSQGWSYSSETLPREVHACLDLPPCYPAVVLSRLSSRRLPGKALVPIGDRTLLGLVADRLRHCPAVGDIIVATSTETTDDAIEEFCRAERLRCFRGSLGDVAGRALGAASEVSAEYFFRVNGDSPFIPIDLYSVAAGIAHSVGPDIVTNVFPRALPPGLSVELLRTEHLRRSLSEFTPEDREHVTTFFYQHPSSSTIQSVPCDQFHYREGITLAVDDASDLERARRIVDQLEAPAWAYGTQGVLSLMGALAGHEGSG